MSEKNIAWLPLAGPQLETWPITQACALTGIELEPFDLQADIQHTEPHQQGQYIIIN